MKWYTNNANESDIVLSTRVRLARNLRDYPFPANLNKDARNKVNELVKDILISPEDTDLKYTDMSDLTSYQAVSLAEKHLISPEFASDNTGRALILSDEEDVSIMLCEEDHVRIQVIYPGLSLDDAYEKASQFDDKLGKSADIAFDERIGYLTQCPTNLGTGMRASVMLHLPALGRTSAISRLATTVAKLGLTLRGAYGEGSEPIGDIYQLSNQVTLGISEKAAIQNLQSITEQIVTQERKARESLLKDDMFIDKIWRAYGILKNAHMISCNEFTNLVSLVRLGASAGIISVELSTLSRLLIEMQPATINASAGTTYSAAQRDVIRAKSIKEALN
ncbi:MAG: protein arginine kinase [Faecalibacterium sp.]|nr:protein arginine kinase [Ruminococcus sp.]MCM1392200.1 protein arginine kinase [Ruminococcus sp.]MCM1485390.1 protein arginine kinase [Faecalibacterium sp.]